MYVLLKFNTFSKGISKKNLSITLCDSLHSSHLLRKTKKWSGLCKEIQDISWRTFLAWPEDPSAYCLVSDTTNSCVDLT